MPVDKTIYGFEAPEVAMIAEAVRTYLEYYYPGSFGDLGIDQVPSFDQAPLILGKTNAAHNKGATGTIKIYGLLDGATIGSETDTTQTITGVYNRFADLDADKWVYVIQSQSNGGYELIAAEC